MIKYFCDVCQKEKSEKELRRHKLRYGSYEFESLDVCDSCWTAIELDKITSWRKALQLARADVAKIDLQGR